ncbi:MAG: DnaT-like ssDNA-binding domain-containing protein [Pseudomonadota bacterium]
MPSLLPERAIAFSPSLAATLGLEEAVMLQGLQEISIHASSQFRDGDRQWQHADRARLRQLFPFWADEDIERIANSLQQKGVLLLNSAPYNEVKHLYYALNDGDVPERRQGTERASDSVAKTIELNQNSRVSAHAQQTRESTPTTKQAIAANWQPDTDTCQQIAQHGIDAQFAHQQLPEFVTYWRQRGETNYAWGNKFLKHVLHEWRRHQASQQSSAPMSRQWRPSEDAMELLLRIDITREFIEDAIPEFVLYWRERGDGIATWNTKFVAHVKKQWARFNATLQYDNEPRLLPSNWQPNNDVFEILALANIDANFARSLLPEFQLFWNDNKQMHTSWNTKFLQHVKYQWARQHQFDPTTGQRDAQQQTASQFGRSEAKGSGSTFERLTDRSWASSL